MTNAPQRKDYAVGLDWMCDHIAWCHDNNIEIKVKVGNKIVGKVIGKVMPPRKGE